MLLHFAAPKLIVVLSSVAAGALVSPLVGRAVRPLRAPSSSAIGLGMMLRIVLHRRHPPPHGEIHDG
ncbi:hypothetical protein [Sorangium sp. So ce426]|uniref:hypothetical protein n=1 Tax=Sorangium sp. So ce426 TaxID=3133312 RepID=UPI003F5C5E7F